MRAPLKIKIFLWYLRKGIILTKDNLAKRNWQGSQKCCFCNNDETIKHLFFDCQFTRVVWTLIHVATGLPRPRNVANIFGTWLGGLSNNFMQVVYLGVAAFCWSVWLCRNDLVFEKKSVATPLQVIYSVIHWLRTWAIIQKIS